MNQNLIFTVRNRNSPNQTIQPHPNFHHKLPNQASDIYRNPKQNYSNRKPQTEPQRLASVGVQAIHDGQNQFSVRTAESGRRRRIVSRNDVEIKAVFRIPICEANRESFEGILFEVRLAHDRKAVTERNQLNQGDDWGTVVVTVLGPRLLSAIEWRMTAVFVGFSETMPDETINRRCSSDLQATQVTFLLVESFESACEECHDVVQDVTYQNPDRMDVSRNWKRLKVWSFSQSCRIFRTEWCVVMFEYRMKLRGPWFGCYDGQIKSDPIILYQVQKHNYEVVRQKDFGVVTVGYVDRDIIDAELAVSLGVKENCTNVTKSFKAFDQAKDLNSKLNVEHISRGEQDQNCQFTGRTATNVKNIQVNIKEAELKEELTLLVQECSHIGDEQREFGRKAESVRGEMSAEWQELLHMFSLPYIIAPIEAEAQCAYMELVNMVDDVVTDDSIVFLIGAGNVHKKIFDDCNYVETNFMKDEEKEFGLTREEIDSVYFGSHVWDPGGKVLPP